MSFDVDAYRRSVRPVRTDDIDFTAFERRPLDEATLRCVRYMHDIESHTVCYLRDLLLTRSHADPRVTTFLTMWAYEEYWHGVALGEVLRAHGEPAEDERLAPMRERLQTAKDKAAPYLSAIGSAVLGDDFVAVHMTWGAVNEWSTQQGYERLAERAGHPVLTELLGRIAAQESRHIAFYASEARQRLASSARARKVTRFALRRLWAPVGTGAVPAAETDFVIRTLFSGTAGLAAADRIDRHVDRLPGLRGLGLLRGAVARTVRDMEPEPVERPRGLLVA
jgi:rubrerythrin